MKIGTRLGFSFSLVTLLTAILTLASWIAFNEVDGKWKGFADNTLEKQEYATQGYLKLGDGIHHFKNYLLRGKDYDKKFVADMDGINAAVANYKNVGNLSDQEKELLDQISKAEGAYRAAMAKMQEMKAAGTAITEIDSAINGADRELGAAFSGLLKIAKDSTRLTSQSLDTSISRAEQIGILIGCITALLAAGCAVLATRAITRPLNEAVKIAQTVAAGDLTSRIEVTSKDETGQLLQALRDMNASLQHIVAQVRTGSDAIVTASSQIASGNLDLSSRTEQQAGSLEETASSMEELTSTVKQNGDNARQANQLALSASDVASKGGKVVSQVVETMGSINESAKKIVDIIGVIDGIAFQTNILALNAAVEAARAGEQGRGFAVVATEVRNLAQRSASAAKEIKALIGDSVEKVETGSKLVSQAGTTMEEIVSSVKRVTDIMGEIASASGEQEAGIGQINQAITEMDNVTQQNAALVEESAAAAASLQEQAASLAKVVSMFKLDAMLAATVTPAAKQQRAMPARTALKPSAGKTNPVRIGADSNAGVKKVQNAALTTSAEWEEF